jgi:hypothetical protein
MTQTTWERRRMYAVNGYKFLYYKDALAYARNLFRDTGVVAGIESTYEVNK